jgi:sec-independent protein translocase protein TatC
MSTAIRTIGHEDRLSLVDHLDELRNRLIVCAIALGVAFGICFWQNHELLHLINKPLVVQTRKQVAKGNGVNGQTALAQQGLLGVTRDTQTALRILLEPNSHLSASARTQLAPIVKLLQTDVAKIPRVPQGDKPVTLGVGEPFTTTITVVLYFAFVLSLPVILFELYGFVLPAFSPNEKRIAMPLMIAIPFLFVIGVAFGYFVVLPAAVRFFQNFNSGQFNVLVQASQYYKFAGIILLAMGLIFQVPVGVLAVTRAGIVSPKTLAKNRRYAIVLCAAVAAFLPGDAITLILETVPLYLLFEISILLAAIFSRRDAKRAAREALAASVIVSTDDTAGPTPHASSGGTPADPIDPDVQDIIDHTDDTLSSD